MPWSAYCKPCAVLIATQRWIPSSRSDGRSALFENGTLFHQQLKDLLVAIVRSKLCRSLAIQVLEVHVGAVLQGLRDLVSIPNLRVHPEPHLLRGSNLLLFKQCEDLHASCSFFFAHLIFHLLQA